MSNIPLDDPKEFDTWLRQRWEEKDLLLEYFSQNGRFPADDAATAEKTKGYIETEVRLVKWYEVGQIFVVPLTVALLINVFTKVAQLMTLLLSR